MQETDEIKVLDEAVGSKLSTTETTQWHDDKLGAEAVNTDNEQANTGY